MTLTNEPLELLKTDIAGRVRTSPERGEALLDEFERGGLSGMRFAARYGLKYPTFASWVARRRRERMEAGAGPEGEPESDPARAVQERASAPAPAKRVRWLEAFADMGARQTLTVYSLHSKIPRVDIIATAADLERILSRRGRASPKIRSPEENASAEEGVGS